MENKNPAQVIIDFLNQTLEERKLQNSSYSARALADDLDVNSGILSSVLNGKRKLTFETAAKWLDAIGVEPHNKQYLLTQLSEHEKITFRSLTPEESSSMQILELTILSVFKIRKTAATVEDLAGFLENEVPLVQAAVKNLCDLGFLKLEESLVTQIDHRLPKTHYYKEAYEKIVRETMSRIETNLGNGLWLNGLSSTFSVTSSNQYMKDNYEKFLQSVENIYADFQVEGGDTVFQGLVFITPVTKPLK